MAEPLVQRAARRYGITPRGIIHVGGHLGQEAAAYAGMGVRTQVWIEPQPDAFDRMKQQVEQANADRSAAVCLNVACGSHRGTAKLRQIDARGGGMSSLLDPGHEMKQRFGADVSRLIDVPVVPLDDLIAEYDLDASSLNTIVIDVQGFELEVLRGATQHIKEHVDLIVSEVSRRPLYEGSCLERDLDDQLRPLGLERVYTRLKPYDHGDAVYLRWSRAPWHTKARVRTLGPRVRRLKGGGGKQAAS